MKGPSQVGNGENYPSSDSPDRGARPARLIWASAKMQGRLKCQVCTTSQRWPPACRDRGQGFGQFRSRIADREIELPLHLTIGVLGETDRALLGHALPSRGDIDAVTHQVPIGLLDDVAQMNADPELDALLRRDTRVAFDHSDLDFDRAAHCVDDAAELGDEPVARALDDTPVMRSDGGIDEIATEARRRARVRSSSAAASRL